MPTALYSGPLAGVSEDGQMAAVINSAADELFALQVAQFKHDEFYHREIARLTVHARLNHIALHFCKYVGQIAQHVYTDDTAPIERTITDTFIIALSAANTVGLSLASALSVSAKAPSVAELGSILRRKAELTIDRPAEWLLRTCAVGSGRIARACEKIDHVEAFPFHEEIAEGIREMCETSLVAANLFRFDLVTMTKERLSAVEAKYLFHNIR